MFNVTVISIKDFSKYIIKIGIAIGVIGICFSLLKKKDNYFFENKISSNLLSHTFLECLDVMIPGMKQIEWDKGKKVSTIQKILSEELKVASHLELVDKTIPIEVIEEADYSVPETANTEVLENGVKERYNNSYEGVNIKNETDIGLTEEMLSQSAVVENPKNVLIYHTHTCESYTPSEQFQYEMTGNFRTTDLSYNVVRVGTELSKMLEQRGFKVIHDESYHDFPAYSGSYDRSYTTVENTLAGQERTDILIDIHRDSIGDSSYAPTVRIGEEYAAQLMFVIGTNGGGLEHPDWILNLRAAIKIQAKANEKYPGLFKPIVLRNSRYNQNLGRAACIIEVGATGNTMEQCITSMKYLAEVLDNVQY